MPSIDLIFGKIITNSGTVFIYSIKNNGYSPFNAINGQILVLNNRNEDLESEIARKRELQNLSFSIEGNNENPIIIPIPKNKKNTLKKNYYYRKQDNKKYDYELKIDIYKEKFIIYLIFKDDKGKIIGEYVNIKTKTEYKQIKEIKLEIINKKKKDSDKAYIKSNEEIKKNEEKKYNKRPSSKIIIESIDKNIINLKDTLVQSKIGLDNAKATCYMASILQTFIHTEPFLNIFLQNKNNNGISNLLYNLFSKISLTNKNSIPIKDFAESFNIIDNRYTLTQGNNPILFITNLLEHLDKENKNRITPLFKGKKKCCFKKNVEMNYEEDFLIYLIQINDESDISSIKNLLINKTIMEMGEQIDIMTENIIKTPPILIINIDELDNRGINIDDELIVCNSKYLLYAINSYTNSHSTV